MAKMQEMVTTPPLYIVTRSEKAILVRAPGAREEQWIPIALIEDPGEDELEVGTEQEITIPKWLAEEKDLKE